MRERTRRRERQINKESMRRGSGTIIEIEEAQARRKQKRAEIFKAEKVQRRIQKARMRKERPKMSAGKKFAVAFVIIASVALFGAGGYKNIELGIEKAETQKIYEQKLAEKLRLEKQLTAVNDLEYIEQEARDRFHMLKDGEILYVFPDEQADNTQ
jgi:cell division protein FtsB